jgi:hypothetical protein
MYYLYSYTMTEQQTLEIHCLQGIARIKPIVMESKHNKTLTNRKSVV